MEFEVGDWVYLKLQPYRLRSLAKRPNEKLASRFYGPFQVISKVGAAAYKLELQNSSNFSCVFTKESTPTAPTTSIIASYAE